jgi:hypothetical protein
VRKGVFIILLLALVIVLAFNAVAFATSFAGNSRSAGYGVKANIYCPASAPYVGSSGQSNWVSTPPTGYWVQAGWRYYSGYSYAKSYYEYCLPIGYNLVETSVQSWGAVRTYEVSHSGSGVWAIKINNSSVGSFGTLAAPVYPVKAMSESHNPTVQLNTQFGSVKYRGTSTWYNFDESGWWTDSPYYLSITSTYQYKTLGP